MYKWHVHSAIGRGRPLTHDIASVAEGIATTLRAFSSSARRAEGNDSGPSNSRAARSSEAVSDISSLSSNPTRGIDARSLAARPPPGQSITIRRTAGPIQTRAGRGGGLMRTGPPRSNGPSTFRGRSGAPGPRGRPGGAASARGGRGGRGGARPKRPKFKADDTDQNTYDPPWTPEELEYIESQECGDFVSYNPKTSLEDLHTMSSGMPTMGSKWAMKEAIFYKMQVPSKTLGQSDIPTVPERHYGNMERGFGTVFANLEEKERLRERKDMELKEIHRKQWKWHDKYEIEGLRADEKEALLKQMVAGVYQAPKDVKDGLVGQIVRYARKNETFLAENERTLEDSLKDKLAGL
ncbi:hypothetical protein CJF32_00000649 [Rutstroemia sp. NJR-2017a WRK4]|nr:hypothetical protein CJF32_00000649 [Rutstroemia sp. NJR-2017a WRK4]